MQMLDRVQQQQPWRRAQLQFADAAVLDAEFGPPERICMQYVAQRDAQGRAVTDNDDLGARVTIRDALQCAGHAACHGTDRFASEWRVFMISRHAGKKLLRLKILVVGAFQFADTVFAQIAIQGQRLADRSSDALRSFPRAL